MVQLTQSLNVKISVIHGPNLNLLGHRDPEVYGKESFDTLNRRVEEHAKANGIEARIFQSNSEGALIDQIQEMREWADAIVINAGAYSHYSYAIRDALADTRLPVVEVHLSNVHSREEFRRHSVISPIATGIIAGFGAQSYLLALTAAKKLLEESHR